MTDAEWRERLKLFREQRELQGFYPSFDVIVDEEYEIRTWDDFKRGSEPLEASYCFRGHNRRSWVLQPNFDRSVWTKSRSSYGGLQMSGTGPLNADANLEQIIAQYQKGSHYHHESASVADDIGLCLSHMQHYGGPTRLLDFTRSAPIALFFALQCKTPRKAAVWAVDFRWLQEHSDNLMRKREPSVEDTPEARRVYFNRALKTGGRPGFLTWVEPKELNRRMTAQQGMLLFSSNNELQVHGLLAQNLLFPTEVGWQVVHKVGVSMFKRQQLLKMLDREGINWETMYPDADCETCVSLKHSLHLDLQKQRRVARRQHYREMDWLNQRDVKLELERIERERDAE